MTIRNKTTGLDFPIYNQADKFNEIQILFWKDLACCVRNHSSDDMVKIVKLIKATIRLIEYPKDNLNKILKKINKLDQFGFNSNYFMVAAIGNNEGSVVRVSPVLFKDQFFVKSFFHVVNRQLNEKNWNELGLIQSAGKEKKKVQLPSKQRSKRKQRGSLVYVWTSNGHAASKEWRKIAGEILSKYPGNFPKYAGQITALMREKNWWIGQVGRFYAEIFISEFKGARFKFTKNSLERTIRGYLKYEKTIDQFVRQKFTSLNLPNSN